MTIQIPHRYLTLLLLLSLSWPSTHAHGGSNGMDMSMDGAMALDEGNMLTHLHFTPLGDSLWFLGWVPRSNGAMVGTCIGLFLLAVVERWMAACKAVMEEHWNTQ
jgi:copper transporter 1